MLKLTLFTVLATVAVALVPAEAANASTCTGGEDAMTAVSFTMPGDTHTHYAWLQPAGAERISFWVETNGKAGLQPTMGTCGSYVFQRPDARSNDVALP